MPVSLPYLVSYRNLPLLFDKIAAAKVPEKFNREFLQSTIGLKGSNDRAMIPLLRTLGFIDASGSPLDSYRLLKGGAEKSKTAMAAGVRKAYGPLFDSDQNANELSGDRLKSLVAQVAGTDDDLTTRIAGTFASLVKLGDFKAEAPAKETKKPKVEEEDEESTKGREHARVKGLRPEFHYNIQVHLPANGTEDVYLNIFNALRKTFQ